MAIEIENSNVITDRLLRSSVRCARKAWLDRYGNKKQRIWSAHRVLQLDHQHRSFSALIPTKAEKGIKACEKGCDGIIGLRLKGIGPSGVHLEAHPPLLQKIKGESRWGKYQYMPVIARQGHKITREHRLALSLSGLLLENFQKASVPEGLVISKTNVGLEIQRIFLYRKLRGELIETLEKLSAILKKTEIPSITSDRRKCTLCSWRSLCNQEATERGNLSEVSGVGHKRKQILEGIGIHTLQELAKTNPRLLRENLQKHGVQHSDIAHQLVSQARAQQTACEERLKKSPSLPELSNTKGVLIYDIESDPDTRDDFLHGFLQLKHNKNRGWNINEAKYHPILTLSKHGKHASWNRIKKKLILYQDFPILHYGETEAISLLRLAKLQGAKEEEIIDLKSRLIDIHSRLRLYWRLPLNSYSLKTVANWTGFKWRIKGADGAKALLWWRQWQGSKGRRSNAVNILKWLFDYNQDDCLATWAVTEWMLKKDSS